MGGCPHRGTNTQIEHPKPSPCVWVRWKPEQASAVLALLPTSARTDVSLRLATIREVQPDVLAELSENLQEILSASMGMSNMSVGGAELMADILTRVDKNTEGAIASQDHRKDQALADSIRALMFVFDDLVGLDSRAMQELMKGNQQGRSADCAARRHTGDQEKFLKRIYVQPCGRMLKDMETRGPVKVSDVEKSQQNILKVCRKLEEEAGSSSEAVEARRC